MSLADLGPVGHWQALRKRAGLPYDATDCERARTLHEVLDLLELVVQASPARPEWMPAPDLFGIHPSAEQGARALRLLGEGQLWAACLEAETDARAARA